MKLTHIASATTIVEHNGVKILTDPWLIGKEFYGSWTHYPPLKVDWDLVNSVNYIYISHIHPDHMSQATLAMIDPDIPVLIHNYEAKFVKNNLERWGHEVIELNHGEKFACGGGLNIQIFAADNCNPALCYKFFGCGKMESKMGSTGIDTMAVFENSENVILNINDCPYDIAHDTLDLIKSEYSKIDLLLVGYAGAGSYPQCWDYSDEDKLGKYGKKKKTYFLNSGVNMINHVNPAYYMPFAGTYTLNGKHATLDKFRVVPELQDALSYFKHNDCPGRGVLLNPWEHFELTTGLVSAEYEPVDLVVKQKYIEETLVHYKYTYEDDEPVVLSQITELIPAAYEGFERKRKEMRFSTKTNVYLYLPDDKMLKISMCGKGYELISRIDFNDEKYVTYKVDEKLLYRILKGPRFAHWNNAEIGSHIMFARKPEIYERALYFCMNYFHA